MKRLSVALWAVLLIVLAVSCGAPVEKEVKAITALENELTAMEARPDAARLGELLDMYLHFVDQYSDDARAQEYLYKALSLSIGTNNGVIAMELADRMLNEFPKSERIPETVFLKAFIYENQLSNLGLALKTYQDFLLRFPEHELADDAEAAINNLGKTPEELIREFEAKAAEQSAE
jgi:outer membrane protein assembly factor BamD (BamD/ComL family)